MSDFANNEFRIFEAFLLKYSEVSQLMQSILESLDETERREAIARTIPDISKFLENSTYQELQTKLMIVSVAYAVTSAVGEGIRILQGE